MHHMARESLIHLQLFLKREAVDSGCPLTFVIYVNDLVNVSTLLHFILFVEDINIFIAHTYFHTMLKNMNKELKR